MSLSAKQINYFVRGNVSLEKQTALSPLGWVSHKLWNDLLYLESEFPDKFRGLTQHMVQNSKAWQAWMDNDQLETIEFPAQYTGTPALSAEKVTTAPAPVVVGPSAGGNKKEQQEENQIKDPFQMLMLVRTVRVDRVVRAVEAYVSATVGQKYVNLPVTNIQAVYEQSSSVVPVLFILSPGSDPAGELMKLAERLSFSADKIKSLAMGQGQEAKAVDALHSCQSRGHWLLLQNCHLLTRWLRDLEKDLDKPVRPHPDFRLWLTTDPTPTFPISIAQRCFKVVSEPPSGLKRNMKLTFMKITARDFTDCTSIYFGPIVYTLSFFHAVVQERKRFGKLGWNLSYEFNESDFIVCSSIIKTYLNRNAAPLSAANKLELEKKVPWDSLKYLISQVIYGGRVSDEFDRRILTCYLEEYMGDWLFDDFSDFTFFNSPNFTLKLPEGKLRDPLIQSIEDLPNNTPPGVLGLNDNAEIDHFTQAAKALWEHMLIIAPNTDAEGSSKSARDEIVMKAAAAINDKLPPDFVLENVKKQYRMQMSPPIVVLLQELVRYNNLLGIVRRSLKNLESAMEGESVITTELDDVGNSVLNGTIPSSWRRAAPETRKTLPYWLEQLQQRYKQYEEWILVGELPVVWLAGIHVPASLITALIQSACRKNNWPLDRTLVSTEVSDIMIEEDLRDIPKFGCYFSNLFLEGAAWSQEFKCLVRQPPKQLWCVLPLVKITPVEAHRVTRSKSYRAPVYATAARQNAKGEGLVFELDLPTEAHASWWILQGVAALMERD